MQFTEIKEKFALCKAWEERYRLLIQLSRLLPKPSEAELANLAEIEGCESRLWFSWTITPRSVLAYSDARLMQGLLMIIRTLLLETPTEAISNINLPALFDELKISNHLTSTRLNGIAELQRLIQQTAKQNS